MRLDVVTISGRSLCIVNVDVTLTPEDSGLHAFTPLCALPRL